MHKLRKTFISTLIDANMNINTVRKLAGHKDDKVTLNNYCYDCSGLEAIRNQLGGIYKQVVGESSLEGSMRLLVKGLVKQIFD